MRGTPTCPRCAATLRAPGLWSSSWTCGSHGDVLPLQPAGQPSVEALGDLARRSHVPVWLPWPLPRGWVVTGTTWAGDERTGPRAAAVALSGPAPLGGMGEMLLLAEEPGTGLGARYAGLPGPDPGHVPDTAPDAKLHVGGHPTALWGVGGGEDRVAFVGEAQACWLYVVLWPESAQALLLEGLELADARELGLELELVPTGALTPRLAEVPPTLQQG